MNRELTVVRRVIRYTILFAASSAVALACVYQIVHWQEGWADTNGENEEYSAAEDFSPQNPPSPKNFAPRRAVIEQDPITEFPIVSAAQAKAEIEGAELVLGVAVNGEARAYPINMLTGPVREILNDTLGGRAIAATW